MPLLNSLGQLLPTTMNLSLKQDRRNQNFIFSVSRKQVGAIQLPTLYLPEHKIFLLIVSVKLQLNCVSFSS